MAEAFDGAWKVVKEDMECCGEQMSYLESGEYYDKTNRPIWIFQCERCGKVIEDGMQEEWYFDDRGRFVSDDR